MSRKCRVMCALDSVKPFTSCQRVRFNPLAETLVKYEIAICVRMVQKALSAREG